MWWQGKEEYTPGTLNYGFGFVGRKLIDGTYVLGREDYKRVFDLVNKGCKHLPGSDLYYQCICHSAERLNKIVKSVMARYGIS